eukprot:COSAG02_NODE_4701_length_5079_cov_610.995382_2_plen_33_part_01
MIQKLRMPEATDGILKIGRRVADIKIWIYSREL